MLQIGLIELDFQTKLFVHNRHMLQAKIAANAFKTFSFYAEHETKRPFLLFDNRLVFTFDKTLSRVKTAANRVRNYLTTSLLAPISE